MGVDGVFETHAGELNAYQVKFRSGRDALDWRELSTFMGLTDRVAQRVVFTNSNHLPALMEQRTGFYPIRGSHLDALEVRDFNAISAWLDGGAAEIPRKQPQLHQDEAISRILAGFEKHHRATVVMACGTGKTLVQLWVAERLGCQRILVLVPSLALLRQTLHEWFKETSWAPPPDFLCVCSDATVTKGLDDLVTRQSDLDFPVTTDSKVVSRFLAREFDGIKLVFSTYQSARVVAEGMEGGVPFQLGIFDEAHKTAGRQATNFSFALRDDNLRFIRVERMAKHVDV